MVKTDITVIIPLFNGAKYISSTLESVINQDFKNFEVILIDDGSTDNGLDIAYDVLANSEIPHKLVHQRNSGVSIARNRGIDLARGEYIIFLDCDDTIASNHLSSLFDKIKEYNCDFAYTNLSKVDEEGNILSTTHLDGDLISTNQFLRLELEMQIAFNFCQLLYKRSILKENDILFIENALYGEDTEFAYRALMCGNLIGISKDNTYYYLQHDKSTISTVNYERFKFVELLEDLAKNYNNEFSNLIITQRIPRTIFGNMIYFFYHNYPFDEVIEKMNELDLFAKLKKFKPSNSKDYKFLLKIKLFLLNPKIYYLMWKKLKNSID